jgi:general secretion pathway protein A
LISRWPPDAAERIATPTAAALPRIREVARDSPARGRYSRNRPRHSTDRLDTMYLEQFGLQEKPFEQTPDSRYLYASEQHAYALASIKFAIATRDPFVVITGEVGSGKTTLLNRVLSELEADVVAAKVTHTRLSDIELLQMILVEFGFEPFGKGKAELITLLRRFVEQQAAAGLHVAIAVDEAQNLTASVLEELRLLTCIETERSKLVTILLLGQPQLSAMLDSPELEQLRQRCRLRFHIDELTHEEVPAYLRHRMSVAGGDYDQAFAPGVDELIHKLTGGVPRLINVLCDSALVACVVEELPKVTAELVASVARELRWEERVGPERNYGGGPIEDDALPRLTATHRGQPVGEFLLREARNIIGRDAHCEIVIDSKFLSRQHALIAREDDAWVLIDLNSTNGTRVNGRRVKRCRLSDGDEIAIGKHRLVLVDPQPAAAVGRAKSKSA